MISMTRLTYYFSEFSNISCEFDNDKCDYYVAGNEHQKAQWLNIKETQDNSNGNKYKLFVYSMITIIIEKARIYSNNYYSIV